MSDDDNGCCTLEPSPAMMRMRSNAPKPPAQLAAMKPSAVTTVPATRSRRSPQRSARNPAGIWNSAMPPL